jgi:hypothetical protein
MIFWYKLLSRLLVGATLVVSFSGSLWTSSTLGPVTQFVMAVLMLAITPIIILVLFFIFLSVLIPPNPPVRWDKPLSQEARRGLTYPHVNNIRSRSARERRDMVYEILPILQDLDFRPRLPVDYNVPLAHLYTELASFFLADCNDQNILALAAQARCPGAPLWVPDLSRNLRPISASVALPSLERRDSYRPTPVQISKARPQYARFITVKAKHYMEIDAVTDFIRPYFTSKERELQGRIQNASCMMRILSCILHRERTQSLEHNPYDPVQLKVTNTRHMTKRTYSRLTSRRFILK